MAYMLIKLGVIYMTLTNLQAKYNRHKKNKIKNNPVESRQTQCDEQT